MSVTKSISPDLKQTVFNSGTDGDATYIEIDDVEDSGSMTLLVDSTGSTETSPLFMNFVNKCLSDKGYSVIGWQ